MPYFSDDFSLLHLITGHADSLQILIYIVNPFQTSVLLTTDVISDSVPELFQIYVKKLKSFPSTERHRTTLISDSIASIRLLGI